MTPKQATDLHSLIAFAYPTVIVSPERTRFLATIALKDYEFEEAVNALGEVTRTKTEFAIADLVAVMNAQRRQSYAARRPSVITGELSPDAELLRREIEG